MTVNGFAPVLQTHEVRDDLSSEVLDWSTGKTKQKEIFNQSDKKHEYNYKYLECSLFIETDIHVKGEQKYKFS